MSEIESNRIKMARKKLANPYAYLNGEGRFEAVFPSHQGLHEARRVLENPYAYQNGDGEVVDWDETANPDGGDNIVIDIGKLLNGRRRGQKFNQDDLAEIARNLHVELWKKRQSLWPSRQSINPLEALDPMAALVSVGFRATVEDTLGQYSDRNELFEVAGIMDNDKKSVRISRRFSNVVQKFTAAHELGHAILHEGSGLHRDRPLDGASSVALDEKEREANKFATNFLMPEKLVRQVFSDIFIETKFTPTEEYLFALGFHDGLGAFKDRYPTTRDLSRLLARIERFNGEQIVSISGRFGVSTEAMAIRLEELNIV